MVSKERVEAIRAQAAKRGEVSAQFSVDVVRAEDNGLVARVQKTLYVRLKRRYRPASVEPSDDDE